MEVSYKRVAQRFNAPETDKIGIEPALLNLAIDGEIKTQAFSFYEENPLATRIAAGSGNLVFTLAHIAAEEANGFPNASDPSDRTIDTTEAVEAAVQAATAQLRKNGTTMDDVGGKVSALYQRILGTAKTMATEIAR